MKIKKLSLAAAISIGLVTFSSAAFAQDQMTQPGTMPSSTPGAAAPVAQPVSTPVSQPVVTPTAQPATPATPAAPATSEQPSATPQPIAASEGCPLNVAGAGKDIQRQAYAYPFYSGQSNVIPTQSQIYQVGSNNESLIGSEEQQKQAMGTTLGSGVTGAAAPVDNTNQIMVAPAEKSGVGFSKAMSTNKDATAQSVSIQTASTTPITRLVQVEQPITGAAAPVTNQFPDVPDNFWASYDINRLAMTDVVAGYPDRNFKPYLPITRAEFASMMVSGLNMNTAGNNSKSFKDVPSKHWASSDISQASSNNLLTGYGNMFKPEKSVTRAEALSALGKQIPGTMTISDAGTILGAYPDGAQVPSWAKLDVANAINAGLLADLPDATNIYPNKNTSRSEASAMMLKLRQTLALEPSQMTGAASQLQEQTVNLPTMKISFNGVINARSAEIGDHFTAKVLEPVTVNGVNFPAGSRVTGTVVEVIKPGLSNKGGIKVAFDEIRGDGNNAVLPRDILSVKINHEENQNIVSRFIGMPFTLAGKLVGTTVRTAGSVVTIAGNSTENFVGSFGKSTGELFEGRFRDATVSQVDGVVGLAKGVYNVGAGAVTGTVGLLGDTANEVAYVVAPDGTKVTSIAPGEEASVAFSCGMK